MDESPVRQPHIIDRLRRRDEGTSPSEAVSRSTVERESIAAIVDAAFREQPVHDVHTHLFPIEFRSPVPAMGFTSDPTG